MYTYVDKLVDLVVGCVEVYFILSVRTFVLGGLEHTRLVNYIVLRIWVLVVLGGIQIVCQRNRWKVKRHYINIIYYYVDI